MPFAAYEYRCIVCTAAHRNVQDSRLTHFSPTIHFSWRCSHSFIYLFFVPVFLVSNFSFFRVLFSLRHYAFVAQQPALKINYDYSNDLDFGLWSFQQTISYAQSLQSPAQLVSGTPFYRERTNDQRKTNLFVSISFFSCLRWESLEFENEICTRPNETGTTWSFYVCIRRVLYLHNSA